jgi:tetratricopeptide (TPR) repeat protein
MGGCEEAITAYEKASDRSPDFLLAQIGLTACYSALGREEEARAAAERALRISPDLNLKQLRKGLTFRNEADLDRYLEALRRAGLT